MGRAKSPKYNLIPKGILISKQSRTAGRCELRPLISYLPRGYLLPPRLRGRPLPLVWFYLARCCLKGWHAGGGVFLVVLCLCPFARGTQRVDFGLPPRSDPHGFAQHSQEVLNEAWLVNEVRDISTTVNRSFQPEVAQLRFKEGLVRGTSGAPRKSP